MTTAVTTEEAAARIAVAAEALSWIATPYHPHASKKGPRGGVDCAMLLAEVYERAEVCACIDPGFYAIDHHLHRSEELYEAALAQAGARRVKQPELGDIALFRFGRTYSHGAIVVEPGADPLCVHAYTQRGVIPTRLSEDPLAGRDVHWWSPWGA